MDKGLCLQNARVRSPQKLPQFREGRVDLCRLPLLKIVLIISLMVTWNSVQTLSLLQMPDQAGKP